MSACLKSPAEKSAAWLASAKTSMERGDYPRALIELQNAVQATPRDAEVQYQMGLALIGNGDVAAAVPYLRKAADLSPEHTGARLRLAGILSQTADKQALAAAEEYAREALDRRPDDPDLLHALAVAEWRQGRTEAAVETLTRVLTANPAHLESSATLALIQFTALNDRKSAERTLQAAVDRAPDSVEAQLALAGFYTVAGDVESAESRYRQALSIDPKNPVALLQLANMQRSSGRLADADETLRTLSGLPDGSYRTAYAQFLFQTGKRDAAIAELKKHLASEPANTDVRSRLVELYLATDQVGEAEGILSAALRKNSRDPDALEQQGRIHLRAREFQRAESVLKEAVKMRPRSASASHALAHAYSGQNRQEEFREELRRALDLDPTQLQVRLQLAEALRKAKDLNGALAVLEEASQAQRDELPWLVERGWTLLALGRYAQARPEVDRALRMSRNPGSLAQAGLLELQDRKYGAARALLEESLKAAPGNTVALHAVAFSLSAEGRTAAAVDRIRAEMARTAPSADLHFVLGSWIERGGDVPSARSSYSQALAADPAHEDAAMALARLDMLRSDWEPARRHTEGILARNPRHVPALLALGMIEEGVGRHDAAIKAYGAVLQIEPNHSVARNNLAVRLSDNPDTLAEALMHARQVKQAYPDNPEYDDTLGWIYFKMEQFSQAVDHLERAVRGLTGAQPKYHLAMAYFAAGKAELGHATLAAALKQDPNLPEAAMARKMAEPSR